MPGPISINFATPSFRSNSTDCCHNTELLTCLINDAYTSFLFVTTLASTLLTTGIFGSCRSISSKSFLITHQQVLINCNEKEHLLATAKPFSLQILLLFQGSLSALFSPETTICSGVLKFATSIIPSSLACSNTFLFCQGLIPQLLPFSPCR